MVGLGHVSWFGSELYRTCTVFRNGRLRYRYDFTYQNRDRFVRRVDILIPSFEEYHLNGRRRT